MGIQGLLPLLKSIQKPTHLRNFAGQTLGVDAYGWLHRGTVACAIELAQEKPTRKHIEFALNRVRMLIHFGIKPYLVFDGDYLPSKAHTEKDRAQRRKESRRLGLELLRTGRTSMAQNELQKAVDVTPLMARELIEELKRLNVSYVVAPFEADSQLAYLEQKGVISGIISEDSDLLVFGANCLLTKLDQYGECVMIHRSDFTACRDVSLVGWTNKEFRTMAMLSGCDYLAGIERMGLKTAYRLVRKHATVEKVIRTVQFEGKMKVPPEYLDAFTRAERTFLHQWVYCPEKKHLVNLNPVPDGLDVGSLTYLGKAVEPEVAVGVASGDLDPNTKEKIVLPVRASTLGSRVLQTPDSKPSKPITEFFKSRRVPLAELDPNSFTPSPSQQQLLSAQQNVTWSASGITDGRRTDLDATASTAMPSSAPQPIRRAVSDLWANVRTQVSPKRQRLCSDVSLAMSMKGSVGLQDATSRFFSPVGNSPSLRKSNPRKSQDEFELWSDDTLAEAESLALATEGKTANDAESSTRKRKKMPVFADVQGDQKPEPSVVDATSSFTSKSADESQSTSASTVTTSSFSEQDQSCESQVSVSTAATSTADIFSQGVKADFAAFKSQFSFQPSLVRPGLFQSSPILRTPRLDAATPFKPKPHMDTSNDRLVPEAVPKTSDAAHPSQTTPCQRIPVGESDGIPPPPCHTPPAGSPRLQMVGSEDLIVPQSSPPPSPELVDGDILERPAGAKLDLSRFALAR